MKEVILLARRAREGDYMQVDEERSVDWGCVSIPKVTIAGPIRQREWRGGCSTSDGGAGHDAISGSCFRAVDAVQVTEGLQQLWSLGCWREEDVEWVLEQRRHWA